MDKAFSAKKILDYHSDIKNMFDKFFLSLGYKRQASVPIVSINDHSVRFTGSTTNALKQFISGKSDLPAKGMFVVQKCLRSQNASSFLDDNSFPVWGSYFTEFGSLVPPVMTTRLIEDTINLFIKVFEVKKNRLILRVSSQDRDLLKLVKRTNLNFRVDDLPQNLYRHKYGLDGVKGRNFNFGIMSANSQKISDIGNFVLIENCGKQIGAETGFGVSTFLFRYFDLSNSIESSTISTVVPFKLGFRSKYSDALSSTVIMLREGVRPSGRDKGRILRSYLDAVGYLSEKVGFSAETTLKFAIDFEEVEYGSVSFVGDKILPYLSTED